MLCVVLVLLLFSRQHIPARRHQQPPTPTPTAAHTSPPEIPGDSPEMSIVKKNTRVFSQNGARRFSPRRFPEILDRCVGVCVCVCVRACVVVCVSVVVCVWV